MHLRGERIVTVRTRKRDLRTRVTYPVHERVRIFAAAQQMTVYQATERLVLLGLDSTGSILKGADRALPDAIEQFAAKLDVLVSLTDRAVFGALVGYAYARAAALDELVGDARLNRDRALLEAGQEAYQRQLNQAMEK